MKKSGKQKSIFQLLKIRSLYLTAKLFLISIVFSSKAYGQHNLNKNSNMPLKFPFFNSNFIPLINNSDQQLEEFTIYRPSSYITYQFKFEKESTVTDAEIFDIDFLGQTETMDPYIGLVLIDSGENDNDSISIAVNGIILTKSFEINNTLQGILIPLKKGFNTIEIKSESTGLKGLTTGELGLYTSSGQFLMSNKFNLSIFSSTSIIVDKL